jgi:hypothetical protein
MARHGVATLARQAHLPLREPIHRFGENILVSLLVFAHNVAALRLLIIILRRTLGDVSALGAGRFLRSS